MDKEQAILELEHFIQIAKSHRSDLDQGRALGYARALFHFKVLDDVEFYKVIDRILGFAE